MWQEPLGIMWTTYLWTPAMSINVVSRRNCHFFSCDAVQALSWDPLVCRANPMSDASMLSRKVLKMRWFWTRKAMACQAIFSQDRFPTPPSTIQAIQQQRLKGSMMVGTPHPFDRLSKSFPPKDAPLSRPKANTLTWASFDKDACVNFTLRVPFHLHVPTCHCARWSVVPHQLARFLKTWGWIAVLRLWTCNLLNLQLFSHWAKHFACIHAVSFSP